MKDDNIGFHIGDAGKEELVVFDLQIDLADGNRNTFVPEGFGLANNPLDFKVDTDGREKSDFHGVIISRMAVIMNLWNLEQ